MPDTHITNNKLAASVEILSSYLASDLHNAEAFMQNPYDFITETYGVDLPACEFIVVENTDEVQHLTLPYYDGLEEALATALADEDMGAAGGEFVAGAVFLTVGGVALGVGLPLASGLFIAGIDGELPHQQEK